jgi:hypothetical protein
VDPPAKARVFNVAKAAQPADPPSIADTDPVDDDRTGTYGSF